MNNFISERKIKQKKLDKDEQQTKKEQQPKQNTQIKMAAAISLSTKVHRMAVDIKNLMETHALITELGDMYDTLKTGLDALREDVVALQEARNNAVAVVDVDVARGSRMLPIGKDERGSLSKREQATCSYIRVENLFFVLFTSTKQQF